MAKKKRTNGKDQINVPFPPELDPIQLQIWKAVKENYPDDIVLLRQEPVFYSVDSDAIKLNEVADTALIVGQFILSYFPTPLRDEVLRKCLNAGLRVAICDPPDDISKHLLM